MARVISELELRRRRQQRMPFKTISPAIILLSTEERKNHPGLLLLRLWPLEMDALYLYLAGCLLR